MGGGAEVLVELERDRKGDEEDKKEKNISTFLHVYNSTRLHFYIYIYIYIHTSPHVHLSGYRFLKPFNASIV